MINKLLIYSAMTYFEFEILARIYHASRNGGEYIFKKNENFERQLRFLRDHGCIDPHTQIRNLRDGENLIGIVQLTDAGKSFVELREQYESGTNADTVQRDIVH